MKAVDIEKYKDRFPNELSGCQQQRVAIARAVIKHVAPAICLRQIVYGLSLGKEKNYE